MTYFINNNIHYIISTMNYIVSIIITSNGEAKEYPTANEEV